MKIQWVRLLWKSARLPYMVVFTYSNVNEASKAEIVIIGVPDEKKSHSKRKGTSKGPDVLRMVNNESNFFERGGSTIPICPMRGNIVEKYYKILIRPLPNGLNSSIVIYKN